MDVSELLAQKQRNREERAAVDEPEFVLTEREFDYRLRRAFAERERNVEKQVSKLFAEHMAEVRHEIAEAKAALGTIIAEAKAALPRALTADDLAEHHRVQQDVHGKLISDDRKRFRKLEEAIAGLELRLDGLSKGLEGATVHELPDLRSARRG